MQPTDSEQPRFADCFGRGFHPEHGLGPYSLQQTKACTKTTLSGLERRGNEDCRSHPESGQRHADQYACHRDGHPYPSDKHPAVRTGNERCGSADGWKYLQTLLKLEHKKRSIAKLCSNPCVNLKSNTFEKSHCKDSIYIAFRQIKQQIILNSKN